jgi:hypothetical protein
MNHEGLSSDRDRVCGREMVSLEERKGLQWQVLSWSLLGNKVRRGRRRERRGGGEEKEHRRRK